MTSTLQELTIDRATDSTALLAQLRADAEYFRPRLFAIYGVFHRGGRPFLGWGMELTAGEDGDTIFYEPSGATHHASSAEQVLRLHQLIADVQLAWLD
ncbi:MAG TPA: hypothetical protein VG317_18025 [Pseudonocardiaceae bacterium]|jgi:hypothetical protein|nr:hypothetical protein [Pseudonocardiaceae bacterium]